MYMSDNKVNAIQARLEQPFHKTNIVDIQTQLQSENTRDCNETRQATRITFPSLLNPDVGVPVFDRIGESTRTQTTENIKKSN